MAKYRVLQGRHSETKHEYHEMNSRGQLEEKSADTRLYNPGDVFESDNEFLVQKHGADKFEKLPDNYDVSVHQASQAGFRGETPSQPNAAPAASGTDFSEWTVDELQKYAAEEEINVGNAKTKAALVKVLTEATSGTTA